MRPSLCLHDQRLTIVIPSARSFPSDLIWQLESQTVGGDEILVVQNRPRLGSHNWVGITSDLRLSPLCSNNQHAHVNAKHDTEVATPKGVPLVLLHSDEGTAAARNLGWRTAKNDLVLFLDDDIIVHETFLSEVRQYLTQRPIAGVVTFRILTPTTCQWSPLIEATISLDRGSEIYHTNGKPLRLQDVWRCGAGAAMLVNRRVLQATNGFKDQLGAGRENGGTEDTEFLWHASHHSTVEYHGRITVFHKNISNFQTVARKMREYGRAIGHLGGTAKSVDGYLYVSGYCSHLEAATRLKEILCLPTRSLTRVTNAIAVAISETFQVYMSSFLHSSKAGILCDECQGISS